MVKPTTDSVADADLSKGMDPSKIMGQFKIPGFDMTGMMDIQRKNIEMMTNLNHVFTGNLQSAIQRQAELVQHIFEDASSMMSGMRSAKTAQEKSVCQAEGSKKMAEECMTNVRDTVEAFAKSNTDVMETVSNRLSDNLEELRAETKPSRAV